MIINALEIVYFPFPGLERKVQVREHFGNIEGLWKGRVSLLVIRTRSEAKMAFVQGFAGVLYLFGHSIVNEGLGLVNGDYLSPEHAKLWRPRHIHKWPSHTVLNTCDAGKSGWAEYFRSGGSCTQHPEGKIPLTKMADWGMNALRGLQKEVLTSDA